MRAVFFKGKDHPLVIGEIERPQPVKDHVLVRMHFAALNHRDLWIRSEQTISHGRGIVLGSDGAGVVEAVSDEGDTTLVGKEVVINPSHEWGKDPAVQGDAFKILGYPDNGTFSDFLLVSKKYLHDRPQHIPMSQAATIPLSGLTAYRALFTKARIRPGERVLITGIGGGAALWTLQLALAFQAKVFVTSGSQEKLARAVAMGAVEGFNYRDERWVEKAKKAVRGFDVIIDSAGGKEFQNLVELAVPGGRIVIFGRTAGAIPEIPPRQIFWKQLSILGTTTGTRDEFLSLLDFIEKKQIKPVVHKTFKLEEIDLAMEEMNQGSQFGKIVLQIN